MKHHAMHYRHLELKSYRRKTNLQILKFHLKSWIAAVLAGLAIAVSLFVTAVHVLNAVL